ncbi:Spx/MgsR family RNA polymerase-binding regulatory protein [Dokdonella sp.]|uniref:Spx/MgsR family RNA polymerase-binding regulatory protein n=1 Tax=Dokdonella sp. TaxID=2291710 RepID=UPI003784E5CF
MTKVYGLDKCDTCKKARNWLDRFDVQHEFIDYRAQPIAAATLKQWAPALGGWEKFINRASPTWRGLPETRQSPGSAAEWTLLLKEHPALIRRPLVVMEDGTLHQGFSDNLFKRLFGKGTQA